MALGFGRKKPAPEAQDAPVPSAVPPSTPSATPPGNTAPAAPESDDLGAFDLDAFATQLESSGDQVQKSPFDDMFVAPAAMGAAEPTEAASGSAYDFPDLESPANPPGAEPLDFNTVFEAEQRNAIATGQIAPPNAPIPLQTNLAEVASEPNGLFEPQEAPKKKLPLIPILGALVVLGLAGGAASFFTQGSSEDEEIAAPVVSRPARPNPPEPQSAPPQPAVAPDRPAAPVRPAAPSSATTTTRVATGTGTVTGTAKAVTGTASAPLTPAVKSQLKALWKQGADAKHRGDYAAARTAWESALKLRPGHPGFADSIAKLPQ